jgi:hypothetical protein
VSHLRLFLRAPLDRIVYLLLDDFGGKYGWGWPETDVGDIDRPTVVRHLLESQYPSPGRIVAFNTAEGWSCDVSDEIAAELAQACADRGESRASSTTIPG